MSQGNRSRHPRRTFSLPDGEWRAFLSKHRSGQARIQELIRMDVAGLIPDTTTAPAGATGAVARTTTQTNH